MNLQHPPLVHYSTEENYRLHFERIYCQTPINTFDGISVRFRKEDFYHCMFESSKRNDIKDRFSQTRSQRIDWIKEALTNPNSQLFCGWDSKKKKYDTNRRVTVIFNNYIVVIALKRDNKKEARFITAYLADTQTSINKIKTSPQWKP